MNKTAKNQTALDQMMSRIKTAQNVTGEVSATEPSKDADGSSETILDQGVVESQQLAQNPIEDSVKAQSHSARLDEQPSPTEKPTTQKPAAKTSPKSKASTDPISDKPNAEPLAVDDNSKLLMVDLNLLHDNPYNARTFYDPNVIKDRASSISAAKQIVPIKVVNHPEEKGAYIIIDGHYRKRALMFLNHTHGKVLVDSSPITNAQMYIQSFMSNNERASQTVYDNAVSWRKLLDDRVFASYDELSNAIQVSKANISKSLSCLELPASSLALIKENPAKFSLRSLYELHRYFSQSNDEDFILEMVNMLSESETSIDIVPHIERQERKKDRKPRTTSRKHTLAIGNSTVGQLKDWGTGKFTMEINLDPDQKKKFIEHMASFMEMK